jgi:hypothetical protein
MKKSTLFSHILSPSPCGQAVMLYRILSCNGEANYYLIHTRTHSAFGRDDASDQNCLAGMYYSLPLEPALKDSYPLGFSRIVKIIYVFISLIVRTRNMPGMGTL